MVFLPLRFFRGNGAEVRGVSQERRVSLSHGVVWKLRLRREQSKSELTWQLGRLTSSYMVSVNKFVALWVFHGLRRSPNLSVTFGYFGCWVLMPRWRSSRSARERPVVGHVSALGRHFDDLFSKHWNFVWAGWALFLAPWSTAFVGWWLDFPTWTTLVPRKMFRCSRPSNLVQPSPIYF